MKTRLAKNTAPLMKGVIFMTIRQKFGNNKITGYE